MGIEPYEWNPEYIVARIDQDLDLALSENGRGFPPPDDNDALAHVERSYDADTEVAALGLDREWFDPNRALLEAARDELARLRHAIESGQTYKEHYEG